MDAETEIEYSKEINEECGVFGIYAPDRRVAEIIFYGLQALQHRGQESAGIAVSDGENILIFKDLGLVSQVFNKQSLAPLQGHIGIGHTRYSTKGGNVWKNSQPIYRIFKNESFILVWFFAILYKNIKASKLTKSILILCFQKL